MTDKADGIEETKADAGVESLTRILFQVHTDKWSYSSEPCKDKINRLVDDADVSVYLCAEGQYGHPNDDDRYTKKAQKDYHLESPFGGVSRKNLEKIISNPNNTEIILTGGESNQCLYLAFMSIMDYLVDTEASNAKIVIPTEAIFGHNGRGTGFVSEGKNNYLTYAVKRGYFQEIGDKQLILSKPTEEVELKPVSTRDNKAK